MPANWPELGPGRSARGSRLLRCRRPLVDHAATRCSAGGSARSAPTRSEAVVREAPEGGTCYRSPFEPPRVSGLIGLGRMGSGFGDGVGLGPPGWGSFAIAKAYDCTRRSTTHAHYLHDQEDGSQPEQPSEPKKLPSVLKVAPVHMQRKVAVDLRHGKRLRVLDVVLDQELGTHCVLPVTPRPEYPEHGTTERNEGRYGQPSERCYAAIQRGLTQ